MNINEKFDNQPDKWWTKIVGSSIYKVRFERELLEKNIAEKAAVFSSFC